MADYDVVERRVPNELRGASAAALGGADVERIADEVTRGLGRLLGKAFRCPALDDMEEALRHLLGSPPGSSDLSASAAHATFLRAVLDAKLKWVCLPCAPIAALAAERAAIDLLRGGITPGDPVVRHTLERRFAEALADGQWLSRIAGRIMEATGLAPPAYVGWRDLVLRAVGDKAHALFTKSRNDAAPSGSTARRPELRLVDHPGGIA